ncbi:MAG: family helicase [Pedosphaera sp.]|nr:family helicase [Pedosphaera sp.]
MKFRWKMPAMAKRLSVALPVNWEKHFPPKVLQLGQECERSGAVLSWEPDTKGGGLIATVQGPDSEPYDVNVEWGTDESGEVFLDGMCDCRKMTDCEHVVAAIQVAANAFAGVPATPGGKPTKPKLSGQLQNWLQQLQQAAAPPTPAESEAANDNEPERLAYVLKWEKPGYGILQSPRPQLAVHLQIVSKLQNGSYGNPRNYYFDYVLNNYSRESFVRPVDTAIVRRLKLIQPPETYGNNLLTGPEGATLLEEILRTGRCYWRSTGKKNPPLALGSSRLAKLVWAADNTGMQSPGFEVTPPAAVILPLAPPWYIDEGASVCGPLDTGLSPAVAEAWYNAPPLVPDQAELLNEELTRRYPELQVPAPQRIEVETVTDLKPVPSLKFFSIPAPADRYYGYYGRSKAEANADLNLVRLEFDYEGRRVPASAPGLFLEQFHDGKLRRVQRQTKAESLASAVLSRGGFLEARDQFYYHRLGKNADALTLADPNGWFEFCQNQLPQLRADGWQVEFDKSFRFRIAEPESWYVDAEEGSGIDWFGVELGVQLDGQKINLLPVLLEHIQKNPRALTEEGLAALKKDETVPIYLADGRVLPFPGQRLKEILGVLLELFDPRSLDRKGRLQLPKLRAAELSGLESNAQWRWLGGTELRELSRKLQDFSGIKPVAVSPNLGAALRGYQEEGLNWLQFLREYNLGGILADDMGLGKTVQALAHLLHEKESGRMDRPSLVIAPTSLMTNWRQEAERFAPGLKLLVLHGLDRKQHFEKLRDYDLIVTSYPLLPRDQTVLLEQEFHCVILDEAQFIKNPKTQYAQIVCQLKARHPVCLTGTPMENHLGELWSLFNFLLPGFLGDEVRFRKVFRNPIEKSGSEDRRKLLARRVAPFMLRRRKEEVVKELPPKTEIIQNVELAKGQRDLYETIRLAMHARVREEVASKGVSRSHIIILDALLKLRQVCCDPRLLKVDAAKKVQGSAKLELLMDMVPQMVSEGRRILLFSQFTSMLALIEEELVKAKIDYAQLTGQTRDRATPIQRFQQGGVPLFLISLKAGGTGLNLTTADTVIHYDPWWNPAVENQATDRAHRIGQEKNVFVYKLMTVGTVEEKILELQKRKRELVEGLLNEDRKESLSISQEDLDVLFAPIQ